MRRGLKDRFLLHRTVLLGLMLSVAGCARAADRPARQRHQGVSHHSLTAYGRVALAPCDLVVPVFGPQDGAGLVALGATVAEQARQLVEPLGRHREVLVPVTGLTQALAGSPVRLSTMGRGLDQDPAAFLASAAAGRHAATLVPQVSR